MVSTYTNYLIVARDLKTSLSNVASEGAVSRDTAYYKANIDKVSSVDDFLGDYRLYSYAMKSYGLEEMTYAKAFMKKVLESDLSDSSSFANSLTDTRYAEFAAAFKFGGETKLAETDGQTTDLLDQYQSSFDEETASIKEETSYYDTKIDSITSVDQLVGNSRLRNYVLESFGLSTDYTSSSFLKNVLTSDVDDPDSYVNQLDDATYLRLAKAFNFNTDGSIDGDAAQTDTQKALVQAGYTAGVSTFASSTVADSYTTYYNATMPSMTSVSDLMSDDKLVFYIRSAFAMDSSESDSYISAALKDSTVAEALGLSDLNAAFNFQSDGTLADGDVSQDDTQLSTVTTAYATNYDTSGVDAAITASVANYKTRIADVTSIDDFLKSNADDDDETNDDDAELSDMALRAYGIDPSEVTNSQIRDILESDLSDPKSYANQSHDDRFVALAEAFNFDSKGDIEVPLQAQSESVIDDYAAYYKQNKIRFLTGTEKTTASTAADTEATYYRDQISSIKTVSAFLADDRLVSFALEAKGLDPDDVTSDELKKMFASDLDDPDSYVNSQSDGRYAELVASFNFDTDGNLSTDPVGIVQQRGDVLETANLYLRQTLEEEQGDANGGVRLALYFQRNASNVSSAYDILSDDALFEFFTTSFNISSYVSNMDVDKQADMINNFIDLKDLQDPDKVNDLIKRFTAMYDVANSTTDSSALTILSGSGSSGISADTMLAVAQLKTS